MKKILRHGIALLWGSLALLLTAVSCDKDPEPEPETSSVLIYMAANNSLFPYVSDCMSQIRRGFLPEKGTGELQVLVFCRGKGDLPMLMKLTRRPDGTGLDTVVLRIYENQINSVSAETLNRVIRDAEAVSPATHHGLVMWSHSTGYLPSGYYSNPVETLREGRPLMKSFGSDDSHPGEMEITDLAEALPHHYDFILFDSCFMGGVEVAYELREKCDYLAFTPTEIAAQGFPYYTMFETLWNGGTTTEDALKAICEECYRYYADRSGCTVSLVRTAALPTLASVCEVIFRDHRDEIFGLEFSEVQPYFRHGDHWFFDFGDIISQVTDGDEYERFGAALEEAIVYKASTPYFMGLAINKYSGLSMYLPRSEYVNLNRFYRDLAWNIATTLVE